MGPWVENKKIYLADASLILAGALWGSTYPLTTVCLREMPPGFLLLVRFLIGCLVMIPFAVKKRSSLKRSHLKAGLICGFFLFLAFATQNLGLLYAPPGRGAFISGMYVVLVPLFSVVLLKVMPSRYALAGASAAFLGMFLLTGGNGGSSGFGLGDALMLACAASIAGQIISVGTHARDADPFWLAFIQFAVVLLVSVVWALWEWRAAWDASLAAWSLAAFMGVGATSLTFWVQAWAQNYTTPTRTAVIFTMEPVFGAVLSWLWLDEGFGAHGLAGAGLILAGLLLAEMKPGNWKAPGRSRPREQARMKGEVYKSDAPFADNGGYLGQRLRGPAGGHGFRGALHLQRSALRSGNPGAFAFGA